MNARGVWAIGILAAWGAGVAAYAQRELSRSPREKLAEAAARIAPGATYFAVERDGRHVGFASSTIDTIPAGLQMTDYLVADLPDRGALQRTTAQSVVRLSRGLALRDFVITAGNDSSTVRMTGRTVGDTLLEYSVDAPGARTGARTSARRVQLAGPLLLPTLAPLAIALGDPPEAGDRHALELFDPSARAPQTLPVAVRAESLFVVVDSAAYDSSTRRWLGAHADTVRGFHVVASDSGVFDMWIDELGRMIAIKAPGGLSLRRTAYEVAFENWRTASPLRAGTTRGAEATVVAALASGAAALESRLDTVRVRLGGLDLSRLPVHGGSQTVTGDTVTVIRDGKSALFPAFPLPPSAATRSRFARELRPEPMLEVEHPAIAALAKRLRRRDAQPEVVARRIMEWVHDSLDREPSVALPSAVGALRSRHGDAAEHAQLFVALARAAGIPARTVSGIVLAGDTHHHHAWAEVMLQHWVGVDPTFGQFPTDASHVRLLVGGLPLQAELARLVGRLNVDVITRVPGPASP